MGSGIIAVAHLRVKLIKDIAVCIAYHYMNRRLGIIYILRVKSFRPLKKIEKLKGSVFGKFRIRLLFRRLAVIVYSAITRSNSA